MSDDGKVWIHLYGGEQDGWRKQIELRTVAPTKFYVWHVNDEKTIDTAKGKDRMVLQSRLATMAYERFDQVDIDGRTEYRYQRCETADKPVTNPAI